MGGFAFAEGLEKRGRNPGSHMRIFSKITQFSNKISNKIMLWNFYLTSCSPCMHTGFQSGGICFCRRVRKEGQEVSHIRIFSKITQFSNRIMQSFVLF